MSLSTRLLFLLAALFLQADARVAPASREQPLAVTPSDARFDDQWWLRTNASGRTGVAGFATAWERGTGAPVVVAVLDSGVVSHPELNPNIVGGYDFVSNAAYAKDGDSRDADYTDPGNAISAAERRADPALYEDCPEQPESTWHGTMMAGQLAAVTDNVEGVAAANWRGRVLAVRVAGQCGASVRDIVDGMRWAAGLPVAGVPRNTAHPARIVVLSLGSRNACDVGDADAQLAAEARLYTDAMAELRAAGVLVVAAAGNEGRGVARPANCAGAFAVAAANREGYKAKYSNFGRQVALATPGGDGDTGATCDEELADSGIASTGNVGGTPGYAAASGTSFAAPQVAGVATLMLSLNPALDVGELEAGLKRSARPHVEVPLLGACAGDNHTRCTCTASTCGAGLLDADEALAYALAPASYTPPERAAVQLRDERIQACAVKLGKPVDEPGEPEEPPPEDEGGGGAVDAGWLLALAAASALLRRRR